MKRNRVVTTIIALVMLLMICGCGKDTTEIWVCDLQPNYMIEMTVHKTDMTLDCVVSVGEINEYANILFENSTTYSYSITSDSTMIIQPLGEFLYRKISNNEVEISYAEMLTTDLRAPRRTYIFKKR